MVNRVLSRLLGFAICVVFASAGDHAQTNPSGTNPPAITSEVRTLEVKQIHEFPLMLAGGQAVELDIEQLDGQVSLQWVDSEGKQSQVLYTLDGIHGHVRSTAVADRDGEWHFKIATRRGRAAEYRLEITAPHRSTSEDAARASAAQALALGEALRAKGAKENAVSAENAYRESMALWEKAKDACGLRASLNGMGHLQIALGKYAAARDSSEQALAKKCEDLASKGHSLRILQSAQEWLGDLDATISIGEETLKVYQETGDLWFQGLILGNLSGAYDQEGATAKAMDDARQALELARKTGDPEGIVFDEETIGAIHAQRGEYQLALEQLNHTMEDLKVHESPVVEALVQDDLGNVYAALGDDQNALAQFKRSEQTASANTNPSTELDALVDEGNFHLARREYAEAGAVFTKALGIADEKKVTQKRAKALRGLGAAEVGAGNIAAGLRKLLDSRELARSLHDNLTEIQANLGLGDYYFSQGDYLKAEEAYERLRALAERTRSASQLAMAWASLARVKFTTGDLAAAQVDAQNAVATIEDQRNQINQPDLRSSFFQSTRSYYDLYIRTLMALAKKTGDDTFANLALATAEKSRARALTDLLSEQAINLQNAVSSELQRKRGEAEDTLHAAAYRMNRLREDTSKKDRDAVEVSVQEARRRLDGVEGEIRSANRRYSDLTRPAPLTVEEIQDHFLGPNTVLLEYWLSEEESYLWEVTSEAVRSFRLPPSKQIDAASSRFRHLLVSWPQLPAGVSLEQKSQYEAKNAAEIASLAKDLSNFVLKPVVTQLGNKNVVLISDGSLREIPFGLLPLNEKVTLESKNTVTYLPSASSLRWLRKNAYQGDGHQSLAVFADPVFDHTDPRLAAPVHTVPNTETNVTRAMHDANADTLSRLVWSGREAQSIARNLPTSDSWLALGFDANRNSAMNARWESYSVVHFATHALIDTRNPELSGIVLSLYNEKGNAVDGFLRVTDIYNLSIPSQLVVLSTCDSAADASNAGNDVYTLSNAFFYAGTPRLLASLWAVDDRAAAVFMSHFYRALLLKRAPPESALRTAKEVMAKDPRWHAPYYWSGFILEGDWR